MLAIFIDFGPIKVIIVILVIAKLNKVTNSFMTK